MTLTEGEYGAVAGGILYATVMIYTGSTSRPGFYLLYLDTEARAEGVMFAGFDQTGINVEVTSSS